MNASAKATGLCARLRSVAASPRTPWAALALALGLLAPTLRDGLRMDDRWLRAMSLGDPRFPAMGRAPHRLFTFFDGPETLAFLRETGVNPWFADDEARLTFFRPLASLLHFAEFRLLAEATWAMHAVSLALYAALVVVVHRWLTRLLVLAAEPSASARGRAVVGLATALYALDSNHALSAGWLAQRNSILAAIFGVLAIDAHDRAVRAHDRRAGMLAPLYVLLGLWSAEAGVATLFVLAAHGLTLTPREQRRGSFARYLAPLSLWGAGYLAGGYGVRGTGMYLDLVREPVHAVSMALAHLPVLVSLDLGNQPADFWTFASSGQRAAIVGVALVLVFGFGLLVVRRVRDDATHRFLALATVFALVPPCGTQPMGRLVLYSGVFLLPLVAGAFLDALDGVLELPRRGRLFARGVLVVVAMARLLLSPPMLASGARAMVMFEQAFGTFAASLPNVRADEGATALVLNAPDMGFFGYVRLIAFALGKSPPPTFAVASGNRAVTVRGIDAHSFTLRSEGGFVRSATDSLTRSERRSLRLGDAFVSGPLTFTVTHLDEAGRADEARVTSSIALDDVRLRWFAWQGSALVPTAPPTNSEPRVFPAQSFLGHMLANAQHPLVDVPGR